MDPPLQRVRAPDRGRSAGGTWWAAAPDVVARELDTGLAGLTSAEAEARLARYGPNELGRRGETTRWTVLARQLRSPLLLLLIFAAGASAVTGQWIDATIVLAIVMASVGFGYSREYSAQRAIAALRSRIELRTTVLRDGGACAVPARELVPGDVVTLAPGSLVPADVRLIETIDCFVNEATLTGESFPVEKRVQAVAANAALAERTSAAFLGSNVRSGTARALVVATGTTTRYGAIAARLAARAPETDFDRSLRRFGMLLTIMMLVIVLVVFAVNVILGRPPVDTLLFSIALAVGLSPELLPAILGVNLARGAQMMAEHRVVVRRLTAIENLGSMDVLCTDKTGTLTEGITDLDGAFDPDGGPSPAVLEVAAVNAALQAGLANPLDQAIGRARALDLSGIEKLGEIPYDFVRKRVSVVVRDAGGTRLITKGALEPVLAACTVTAGGAVLDPAARDRILAHYLAWTGAGVRVLGVATRALAPGGESIARDDEHDLAFVGFLTFVDRAKDGVARSIAALAALGVTTRMITGDSRLVAQHVARAAGMRDDRVLTGRELDELSAEALWPAVEATELFVEVDPNQKERIIRALRHGGHVVGFLGDGVNDAPAMHAADTSISVDTAVDVAKEAADFVLLDRDLDVIRRGVEEGRRTFANTLKYLLTTTSANVGNMLSMAVASMVLPFLPLLAGQVLLNNFLSDIPAIGVASDRVDPEAVAHPRRWDLRFIARFMLQFGALSSVFDLLTFGLLLRVFAATAATFRTGWFVESLLTELVIALVVRTARPMLRSRPGRLLVVLTLALIPLTLAIPYLPYADVLGFVPLPATIVLALAGVTALYVVAAELLKARFFARR